MKIETIEKSTFKEMTQNKLCKELESSSFCIHNDTENKIIFGRKIVMEEKFYIFEQEVLFCPFCGQSYQPERSKREDAIKECEELGHVNTWMPKNQTLCMRCGALNSMET
jgi:hypothetical protein